MEEQFNNNPGQDPPEVNQSIREFTNSVSPSSEYVSPKSVWSLIKKLPSDKAPGYDKITNTALKHLPKNAIVSIAQIFKLCLRLSHFPDKWKMATIIMIPKLRKDHQKPENHRPISLLTSMSKILEKIILQKLKLYIKPYPEQYAFRECHSTTTQLTTLLSELTENHRNG